MDLNPAQFARVSVRTLQTGDGSERVLNRSFSVDPRTITLNRLHHLVARALDIREEFSMLFLRSKKGCIAPLSCDWDLEGALAEEPCLDLSLHLQPKEPGLEEWDIICTADVPVAGHEASSYPPRTRKGSFFEQVVSNLRPPSPLSESEFRKLEDWPGPLRYATFRANGANPDIRPQLWMHLLDVFPAGAGAKVRQEFINKKAEEYYRLRHKWQKLVQAGTIPTILCDVMNLVRKDVRRTDRCQHLNEHALYNVLTTYAVHHPSIGYCQGMSDLLSPLLSVMNTEAKAYLAFCGLMLRMCENFRHDGRSVNTKFQHLRHAIRAHDPQLHDHLNNVGGLDLLFCYRWLLLDLKREFPYEEMLTLMEVLWSSLPPFHTEKGVELYEVCFPTPKIYESIQEKVDPKDRFMFTENHFGTPKNAICLPLKQWVVLSRKKSIARNIESENKSSSTDEDEDRGIIHYRRRKRKSRNNICQSWSGRDRVEDDSHQRLCCYANTVHDIQINHWLNAQNVSVRKRHGSSDSNYGSTLSEEDYEEIPSRSRSEGYTSGQDPSDTEQLRFRNDFVNSFDSADTYFSDMGMWKQQSVLLPPPTRMGNGKPFLIFLSLTMILNHRDEILGQGMDVNEIGIYFDRLVRKHRLFDVLHRAKEMFEDYLNTGWTEDE